MSAPAHILLVEDDPDHAELALRSIRRSDRRCEVHHVADGAQALDYLFRRGRYADPSDSPIPRIVLLDLRLPKVDGLEVLARVKADEHLREIPIVVLTTSSADADVQAAYARHVNSYIVKPTGFREFRAVMQDLTLYWLDHNRPPALT